MTTEPGRLNNSGLTILSRRLKGIERDVQRIDEAGPFIGELNLAVQLLAERRHHAGAEALPYRRFNSRTSAFSPDKVKPLLRHIRRGLGFLMAIFQKIAASSFAAVRRTLRRRL